MAIVPVYKRLGETPLACVVRYRHKEQLPGSTPVTYAGRLDPMAEGLLLLLTGDDVKKKSLYLDLPKVYEARIISGVETDSYDVLGLVKRVHSGEISEEQIKKAGQELVGEHRWPYPPYSSRTVNGRPLFMWAREGKLDTIRIPVRSMHIQEATYEYRTVVSGAELLQEVLPAIRLVTGDFRQAAIGTRWTSRVSTHDVFTISQWTMRVSSGTYVRSFAQEFGKKLGSGACLGHLRRTQIGDYTLDALPISLP